MSALQRSRQWRNPARRRGSLAAAVVALLFWGWSTPGCIAAGDGSTTAPGDGGGPGPDPAPDPGPMPDPNPEPQPDPQPDPDPDPQPDPDPGFVRIEPRLGPLQGSGMTVADDPAIWIHPQDPSRSLIFCSDKKRGIYVFDLQGNEIQHVDFGTRLNNIDVRRGFRFGSETVDIVAGNLRRAAKLAVLRIHPDWTPGNAVTVLADAQDTANGISRDSYGFALYRRPGDGAMFVFDKPNGSGAIRQWRVHGEDGVIRTEEVRRIDDVDMAISEGFVADDALGFVYFAEEGRGIHKYHADPGAPVQTRLALFATGDGIGGDREGLALYACADGGGYLVLSSQGNSTFKVYERSGANRFVKTFAASGARGTDGLDVCSTPVPGFPRGFLVIHDDPGARYYVYDWADVAESDLESCGR